MDSDLVTLRVEALGFQEPVGVLEKERVVDGSSQFNVSAMTRALCLLKATSLASAEVIER